MKTISYQTYLDKVLGGWIGKSIGGVIGFRFEGIRRRMNVSHKRIFPKNYPANDDLDLQLLWLEVMEKKGPYFTAKDMGDLWMEKCHYVICEYGIFKWNYARGIRPPASGSFNNVYWETGMGCPIRSEIWAMVFPGNPKLAATYAALDGSLDHTFISIECEQMLTAMESEAFFTKDLQQLISLGLTYLSPRNPIRTTLRHILSEHKKGTPWEVLWDQIVIQHGCPEACDARVNIPLLFLVLLYGKGDFMKTMLLTLNVGFDADCTASTAAALMGIMHGTRIFPDSWKRKIGDKLVIGIDLKRPDETLSRLAYDTSLLGVQYSGKVNRVIRIKGTPANLPKISRTLLQKKKIMNFEINYNGLPSIGFGEKKTVYLKFRNETGHAIQGQLKVKAPTLFKISHPSKLQLKRGETSTIPLEIIQKGDKLPQKNMFQIEFHTDKEILHLGDFGICGAARWRVVGPYWDIFDYSKSQNEPSLDDNRGPWEKGYSMRRNLVSIQRDYIPLSGADLSAGIKRTEGIYGTSIMDAHEYLLPLDPFLTMDGDACMYLIQDFISPTDFKGHFLVGCSDAVQIRLNNKKIYEVDQCTRWEPMQAEAPAKIRKGKNQLVVKLLKRSSSAPQLSLVFRDVLPPPQSGMRKRPRFNEEFIYLKDSEK